MKILSLQFPGTVTFLGLRNACYYWKKLNTVIIEFKGFYSPDNTFSMFGYRCPDLSTIKFSHYSVREQTLDILSVSIPKLKVLQIHYRTIENDMSQSFGKMENLEELYLSTKNVGIHTKSFINIDDLQFKIDKFRYARGFPPLRKFHSCVLRECMSCPIEVVKNLGFFSMFN